MWEPVPGGLFAVEKFACGGGRVDEQMGHWKPHCRIQSQISARGDKRHMTCKPAGTIHCIMSLVLRCVRNEVNFPSFQHVYMYVLEIWARTTIYSFAMRVCDRYRAVVSWAYLGKLLLVPRVLVAFWGSTDYLSDDAPTSEYSRADQQSQRHVDAGRR
jgi:hypothetical protein